MNDNVSPMWHQNHQADTTSNPELSDDFSSFLDFGSLPLSLSSPFGENDETLTMDTDFCLDGNSPGQNDRGGGMPNVTQAEIMDMQFHEMQKSMQHVHQQMMNHQHAIQQQQHRHNSSNSMIPPTPTSMEMIGGMPQTNGHDIHSQLMMDNFGVYRDEQIFTPLISPAVTPLETDFSHRISEFGNHGSFSPLTSPALVAHQYRSHMPNPHAPHNPTQLQDSSMPVDPSQSPIIGKKGSGARRKSTTSRNPARVVRESPSMKPQRKRVPSAMTKLPVALAQQSQTYPQPVTPGTGRRSSNTPHGSQHSTPMQHAQASREGSSNESVSPEPLPEVLMAPPPRRLQSSRSPLEEQTHKPYNAPVTPASLMRLPPTSVRTEDIPPISMDTSEYLNCDVQVTEASHSSNIPENSEQMTTPTLSIRTSSLTPSLRPTGSSSGIIRTSRQTSPLDPIHSAGITKKELAPRGSRKRGSISSSPALQPRISPMIKPLLPQGMSIDSPAFLLASKSNYQNIVEGNHSHLGLQYPEHLSTNLTSKRTSHKIAEQGRRNRINNALAEMAGLLPPVAAVTSESGGSGGGSAAAAAAKEQTSKASTVELAIDYIKQLKIELEETKAKLRATEVKLMECTAAKGEDIDVKMPQQEEVKEAATTA